MEFTRKPELEQSKCMRRFLAEAPSQEAPSPSEHVGWLLSLLDTTPRFRSGRAPPLSKIPYLPVPPSVAEWDDDKPRMHMAMARNATAIRHQEEVDEVKCTVNREPGRMIHTINATNSFISYTQRIISSTGFRIFRSIEYCWSFNVKKERWLEPITVDERLHSGLETAEILPLSSLYNNRTLYLRWLFFGF